MPSDEAIYSLDRGGRLEVVSQYWPDFRGVFTAHFRRIWSQDEVRNKAITSQRHDAFVGHASADTVIAEHLDYPRQLFETAFQQALQDLVSSLWGRGERTPVNPRRLVFSLSPCVELAVAIEMSRVPRPLLPLPSEAANGYETVLPVESGGDVPGWYRLASWEVDRLSSDPSQEHRARYCTACTWLTTDVSKTSGPLDPPFVIVRPVSYPDFFTDPLAWPHVDLSRHLAFPCDFTSLLGSTQLLVPSSLLLQRCNLLPGSWPDRVQFVNGEGDARIRFRCWRSRPVRSDTEGIAYRLCGCDLMAHPETVDLLRKWTSLVRVTSRFEYDNRSHAV